jgi:hypothetical protein
MTNIRKIIPINSAAIALTLSLGSVTAIAESDQAYSPYLEPIPRQVFWGDTHLHTNYSFDAAVFGNTQLSPNEAYQLAKGKVVNAHNGMPVRLVRPLDFLVVSDHAEYLGLIPLLLNKDPVIANTEVGIRWLETLKGGLTGIQKVYTELRRSMGKAPLFDGEAVMASAWGEIVNAAEDNNQPGLFTTLHGYEWSSVPNNNNLHRVVIYKDDKDKVSQVLPFSAFDSEDPEDLWAYLQGYEDKTGGEAMAIAHNGNVSNGYMFQLTDRAGKAFDKSYADRRSRWEPLYEVTQIKGDGETHPLLSPKDEFADFETWDKGNLRGTEAKTPDMLPFEYARSALKLGLQQEEKLGTNPFKFGMIGSTDSHTSIASARGDNFWGKLTAYEPSPARTKHQSYVKGKNNYVFDLTSWEFSASGYAAVWAKENTRESLFDAMKRKETYATTGPRMEVRFFGGWDFQAADLDIPDYVSSAYQKGVPMGGDLMSAQDKQQPSFIVVASKDPDGANLDRVQVVKGWLDKNDKLHEKVYNVAASDHRKIKKNKVKPLVSTVVNATYSNSRGAARLATVWQDPDFNADERAFYYARVLQIPTPRWTAKDKDFFNIEMPEEVPTEIQDRAYTSPIWYTP